LPNIAPHMHGKEVMPARRRPAAAGMLLQAQRRWENITDHRWHAKGGNLSR